jgi:hypothetical protein
MLSLVLNLSQKPTIFMPGFALQPPKPMAWLGVFVFDGIPKAFSILRTSVRIRSTGRHEAPASGA